MPKWTDLSNLATTFYGKPKNDRLKEHLAMYVRPGNLNVRVENASLGDLLAAPPPPPAKKEAPVARKPYPSEMTEIIDKSVEISNEHIFRTRFTFDKIGFNNTTCCGLKELHGLSDNPEMDLIKLGEHLFVTGHRCGLIVFSDAVNRDHGRRLARYITEHELGSLQQSITVMNPNSGNSIEAWFWVPDLIKLRVIWQDYLHTLKYAKVQISHYGRI